MTVDEIVAHYTIANCLTHPEDIEVMREYVEEIAAMLAGDEPPISLNGDHPPLNDQQLAVCAEPRNLSRYERQPELRAHGNPRLFGTDRTANAARQRAGRTAFRVRPPRSCHEGDKHRIQSLDPPGCRG